MEGVRTVYGGIEISGRFGEYTGQRCRGKQSPRILSSQEEIHGLLRDGGRAFLWVGSSSIKAGRGGAVNQGSQRKSPLELLRHLLYVYGYPCDAVAVLFHK